MKSIEQTRSLSAGLRLTARLGCALAITLGGVACGKHDSSFSLLGDSATFKQSSAEVNAKIDILFVIDNSGSMQSSQQAMAANIARFFEKFDSKGFDYQIAVTATDSWRGQFNSSYNSLAKYRDGTDASGHSGVFILTPNTPDKQATFIKNMLLGTQGSGDERAFQSVERTMTSDLNAGFDFPRKDAFFSLIILSDADDLSNTTASSIDTAPNTAMYSNPNIIPVQHYLDFLDAKFGATNANRSSKYNVNTIGIFDEACKTANPSEQKIGVRYGALTDMTGGIKGSLCEDFGTTLSNISHKIIELRTLFYLSSQPDPATVAVKIDGASIPRIAEGAPQPWNGFYYHANENSISFHGDYVPGPGADIQVSFDPLGLQ